MSMFHKATVSYFVLQIARYVEIRWNATFADFTYFHVFVQFPGAFTGQRLMSLRSNLAAWLKPPHGGRTDTFSTTLAYEMKWSWIHEILRELRIHREIKIDLSESAQLTQSKALRVNISAKVKGSAGAVSTGLVWPTTLQKVNRISALRLKQQSSDVVPWALLMRLKSSWTPPKAKLCTEPSKTWNASDREIDEIDVDFSTRHLPA